MVDVEKIRAVPDRLEAGDSGQTSRATVLVLTASRR